jgi:hypothetical protein
MTLAYPFRTYMKDWAERIREKAKPYGLGAYLPHSQFANNYVICGVCKEIRARPIHLSEVSEPNWNVFFEAGLAFGFDKTMVLGEDANADTSRSRTVFPEYLRATYHYDDELLTKVLAAIKSNGLKISTINASQDPRRLYFIDPGITSEYVEQLKRVLKKSRTVAYSAPQGGIARTPTMESELYEICSAGIVVGFLLPDYYKDKDIINARSCFLLGVAVGLQRPVLVIAQEPVPVGTADLQMLLKPVASVSTMGQIVTEWLKELGARPKPAAFRRTADLASIDLGNSWAERDPYLDEYFVETAEYRKAKDGRSTVFLGRRGSGKSALAIALTNPSIQGSGVALRTVRPEDFEMEELQQAYRSVKAANGKHWELVLGTIWRYLLLAELAKAYLEHFRSRAVWPDEVAQLQELVTLVPHGEEFLDAVRSITRFVKSADSKRLEDLLATMSKQSIYKPFQELSRTTQARVVIDNLDESWNIRHEDSRFVLASLIHQSEKINRRLNERAAIILFLRSDIYDVVKLSDPDIDKQSREYLQWDVPSLIEVVTSRLRAFQGSASTSTDELWYSVFPDAVEGISSQRYLVGLTMRRPRELLKLCGMAISAAQARRASRVSELDVLAVRQRYAEALLTDLHGEYLIELPGLYYFILEFANEKWPKGLDDMRSLARRAAEREAAAGRPQEWHELNGDTDRALHRLYRIGIIGLMAEGSAESTALYSYDSDWSAAFASTRKQKSIRYRRRQSKKVWIEPFVTMHPGLRSLLGTTPSEKRGPYLETERGDDRRAKVTRKSGRLGRGRT